MSSLELEQLQKAQELVELDPSQYPQIVRGILPFTDHDNVQVRQFCAQFLYKAFGSESIETDMKKALAVVCLDSVVVMLDRNRGDWFVLKPLIGCCSSLYSLLFSFVSENETEKEVWQKLQDTKRKVLRIWNDENVHFSVEISCIKFAERVISAQTYGPSGPDDISLTNVPSGHLLIGPTLDAEALGLLDRLLGVFSERTIFAPRITCTVNALSPLVRSRPGTVQKILRTVLSFESSAKSCNPNASDTRVDLEYKFVDKCLKIFLDSILDLNVAPRMNNQIKNYLSTLSQGRASERLKKRMGNSTETEEQTRKRARSGASPFPLNTSTNVPSGPYSYSALFNLLRPDDNLSTFDAKELPSDIAAKIAMLGLAKVSPELLQNSINVIQTRYKNLVDQAPFTQASQNRYYPVESYGDEDNTFFNDANGESDDNAAATTAANTGAYDPDEDDEENPAALPPASSFSLPVPDKFSEREKKFRVGKIIERFISYGSSAIDGAVVSSGAANANKGINRVAISEWDENTWVLIAARTITRGMCDNNKELKELLRNHLFSYVMENFRDRLEAIVTWLTEEWFSEQILNDEKVAPEESVYVLWADKLLEQIVLLIDKSDSKSWLRLLSDLPELNRSIIWKVRSLCIDPDRSQLGFMSLRYLIMFKPPCKEDCLDLLEEMYKSDTNKEAAGAILKRYRPEVIESA